jgi:serine/threonine-protein kinase
VSLVGRQIGRYRILEQLGQGGMSVVYKGLDTALDREVAVKVLHPHLASKPESRKRLDREARAVARLHHPNILEVYDFSGADSTDAYIVTEYIRGKTLREFISGEPLSPPEIAAMVMHEIAGALAHAHEAGVLHRDLKPENVMVRDDGVIKLTDFGIAKILDRDEKMTMTGALVGSPAHMAPEIIEGEESGAEADVFSLGTMLYLFVTGKLPFTAPNTTATLKRILDCVYEDPRQTVPTCSDELTEIIGTCLQRSPANRYPTAGKLRDALASYLSELGLTRPHEELPKFFLDSKGYRHEVQRRVTETLLERAQRLIGDKKSARALSALNQVLAHDPTNERATHLLDAMKARKLREQRTRRLVRLATIGGAAFVIGVSALKGIDVASRAPEPTFDLPFGPADVVLASVTWAPARADPIPALEVADAGVTPIDAGTVVAKVKPNGTGVKPPIEKKVEPLSPPGAQGEVDVEVGIRPFGFITVDDQPRSGDPLTIHRLKLAPGTHRLLVTCDDCEPQGVSRSITVVTGRPMVGPDKLNVAAPLKPSRVVFDGFPPEAIAEIGAQSRTVAQTMTEPFVISTPPEGRKAMVHDVKYVVKLGDQTLLEGQLRVKPGELGVVRRQP